MPKTITFATLGLMILFLFTPAFGAGMGGGSPAVTSSGFGTAYLYLALSGLLTVLLWTPYILARLFVWGLPAFLHNYPQGYPAAEPEPPLWARRAQRAHLNLVETMPAFVAVVVAAALLAGQSAGAAVGLWAQVFFFARVGHAVVYTLGIPYLRTPVYLVSWAAVLMIGLQVML